MKPCPQRLFMEINFFSRAIMGSLTLASSMKKVVGLTSLFAFLDLLTTPLGSPSESLKPNLGEICNGYDQRVTL